MERNTMKIRKQKHTHSGVRNIIQFLMDQKGVSEYELAKRADIHPTTLFGILNHESKGKGRKVRRSTIRQVAHATGYDVTFDSEKNEIILTQPENSSQREFDLESFAREIIRTIRKSGKEDLSEKEKEKVLNIIRTVFE